MNLQVAWIYSSRTQVFSCRGFITDWTTAEKQPVRSQDLHTPLAHEDHQMPDTVTLTDLADRIESDEDFAMKVGEDARAVFEAEGISDQTIARVLAEAEAEVSGFALPADSVEMTVRRVAAAARSVAAE